jgi:hypothetical protein
MSLPDTIIEGLKNYLLTYTGLDENAPLWVQYLGDDPTQYAIAPLAGERVIDEYINGTRIMAYPFAFQSMESTLEEVERLANCGFYEQFADWLDEQSDAGNLPDLPEGKTAESIEATGAGGYQMEEGESGTAIYQAQCELVYKKE